MGCWMLDSDWLTKILRGAVILQEKHSYEVYPSLLTTLQLQISEPNYFSHFKDAYSPRAKEPELNMTLTKQENITNNRQ